MPRLYSAPASISESTQEIEIPGPPTDLPPATMTVSGDYGLNIYNPRLTINGEVVDMTNFQVMLSQAQENKYPVRLYGTQNAILFGGTINSDISETEDWTDMYVRLYGKGNSAAVFTTDGAKNNWFYDWELKGAWDSVRTARGSGGGTGMIFERFYIHYCRDDAAENDQVQNVTYKDWLLPKAFQGFSSDPGNDWTDKLGPWPEVTMRMTNVVMGMHRYKTIAYGNYGDYGHGHAFKFGEAYPGNLIMNDNVIMYPGTPFASDARWTKAMDVLNTTESRNNLLIWASNEPLIDVWKSVNPACFTVFDEGATQGMALFNQKVADQKAYLGYS